MIINLEGPSEAKPIAADRCRSTSALATMLVEGVGRARARSIIADLWKDHCLLEEEREIILMRLDVGGALSGDFVKQLGPDAEDYVPELRVQAGMDRRWRAKWAEITGEALSFLFLQEALGLDLTTLRRIEERTDRETPDFQARTMANEPIVFESKGSDRLQDAQSAAPHVESSPFFQMAPAWRSRWCELPPLPVQEGEGRLWVEGPYAATCRLSRLTA